MGKLTIDRTGEIGYNKFGSRMEIIKYGGRLDVLVKFEKGNKVSTTYQNFCNGEVKNVYDKSTLGIGYIGEGIYKATKNNKSTKIHKLWQSLLTRCYDEKFHKKQPTYKDCSVCEEWHNFQTFAKWYDQNYYEVEGEKMQLDKDILIKGNKVYSPDSCVFVPQIINNLFLKHDAARGKFPIGVSFNKNKEKYIASCNNGSGNRGYLGLFDTPEEAFQAYKTAKEALIQEKAEIYKNLIPVKLYEVMMNYKVEITD